MTKIVAIVQSNYIPWKGYFDLIASADEFILYDDVQFTRRDWRNRNLIKTPQGLKWLTVPVKIKGRYHQSIRDTEIEGLDWTRNHWKSLYANYRKAPCFDDVAQWLEPVYQRVGGHSLSQVNTQFLTAICDYLGIKTVISQSSDYRLIEGKSDRLADLCAQAGGTHYLSGPAAKSYLDEAVFAARGITVHWFDYADYPAYPQLWGEFVHHVSIVDLLFQCGRSSPHMMKAVL